MFGIRFAHICFPIVIHLLCYKVSIAVRVEGAVFAEAIVVAELIQLANQQVVHGLNILHLLDRCQLLNWVSPQIERTVILNLLQLFLNVVEVSLCVDG